MLREQVHLHAYRSPEYVKDAGTPERLERVASDVRSGVVARGSLEVRRPAIFLDRDGTINEEVSYLTRPSRGQADRGLGGGHPEVARGGLPDRWWLQTSR